MSELFVLARKRTKGVCDDEVAYFSKTTAKITPEDSTQRISSITVRVCVTSCTGSFYITDIMLQDGSLATGWVGHPSEIQWTSDG